MLEERVFDGHLKRGKVENDEINFATATAGGDKV